MGFLAGNDGCTGANTGSADSKRSRKSENDPDRAERIHDAAEHGCDGSTHAEHIEDWREFAAIIEDAAHRDCGGDTDEKIDANEAVIETAFAALAADIDQCEAWHESNGTLHQEIG